VLLVVVYLTLFLESCVTGMTFYKPLKSDIMSFRDIKDPWIRAQELRRIADWLEGVGERVESLPQEWEDLPERVREDSMKNIVYCSDDIVVALSALSHLHDLRQVYWGDWRPDWDNDDMKYIIYFDGDDVRTEEFTSGYNFFLVFPTEYLREHFLEHHRYIIEKAQPLL